MRNVKDIDLTHINPTDDLVYSVESEYGGRKNENFNHLLCTLKLSSGGHQSGGRYIR